MFPLIKTNRELMNLSNLFKNDKIHNKKIVKQYFSVKRGKYFFEKHKKIISKNLAA